MIVARWPMSPLASIVDILDGRRVPVKATERAARGGQVPYYGATGRAGSIDRALFDEPLVLVGEDGAPFLDPYKQKAYLIDGPSWVNNHAHVLRPTRIDRRFLKHYLDVFDYRGFANGTTRLKLTQAALRSIPVPVPNGWEQQRVVESIDEHLSRLDAADGSLAKSQSRLKTFLATELSRATRDESWEKVRLDSIAEIRLGRQRSPKNHEGDRLRPYLRAANVGWDSLDFDDIKMMNFTEAEEEVYSLQPGDILLTEASGSPAEVGKSAIIDSIERGICFQNTLLRVRCRSGDPRFIQKQLLAHAMLGGFMPRSRGVGINHLGRASLAALPIYLPDPGVQEAAVLHCRAITDVADRLAAAGEVARVRGRHLRRAVLAAAFDGQLTGRASDTDIIEETAETLTMQERLL